MKKYFSIIIFLFANSGFASETIKLEDVSTNIHDKKSIIRGAKFFSTNCMVCHTMVYLRYNKLAQENGVLYSKMPVNIKAWPNNIVPPDLSLVISKRGANWVWTYLHSFYVDPKRPTGYNNLVVPNTGMANLLLPYQGQQSLVPDPEKHANLYLRSYEWYDLLELQTPGSMTPQEFDATIKDLLNFLTYASTPYKVEQERMGYWVIAFLCILFVLTYLLKKSYWHNIKRLEQK